jgi:putative transposase
VLQCDPKKIVNTVRSLTALDIFRLHPEVKRFLRVGKFWISGYYVNTFGRYANKEVIKKYVQGQVKDLQGKKIHKSQFKLF